MQTVIKMKFTQFFENAIYESALQKLKELASLWAVQGKAKVQLLRAYTAL